MGIFKAKSVIGLEMDAYEIRAAEVGGTVAKPALMALSRIDLPEGVVKDGKVVNPNMLSNLLSRLWNESKFKSKNIMLGISNQDVLIRFALIPKGPEEKMDNIIRFHAQSFLPVPVNEVELDYVILNEQRERPQGEPDNVVKVLYVAARRSMLKGFLQVVNEAGLKLLDIDVSLLALTRCVEGQVTDKPVAIIHYTRDQVGFAILAHGLPALARILTIYPASNRVEENIYRSTAMEEAAFTSMQDLENTNHLSNDIVDEIGSSISYFISQNPGEIIEICMMNTAYGAGANISSRLSENLGVAVKIIDMTRALDTRNLARSSPLKSVTDFSVSISLGLRGLED